MQFAAVGGTMYASRKRASFGRREAAAPVLPVEAESHPPSASVATDAVPYRVLPEPPAVVASPDGPGTSGNWVDHADVLRLLGPAADRPSAILPEAHDHDRAVMASYIAQEQRRGALADELQRLHGHAAIRPFFVFGEGVYNTEVGRWLVEAMRLMPYDAWNTTYLPLDAPTAAAMRLPYHPRRALERIDALLLERLREQQLRHDEALARCVAALESGWDEARLMRFTTWRAALREELLQFAASVRPVVVGLIGEAQEKGTPL